MEKIEGLELLLDQADYGAILAALGRRSDSRNEDGTISVAEYGGNLIGALVADICRDWLDHRDYCESRTTQSSE